MILFPAIDLIRGKCVRLFQGDYDQVTVYGGDPVGMANSFLESGCEWIHVVDLDGAKAGRPLHPEIIQSIANTGLRVQTGGGIRDLDSIRTLLDSGAERVILGSAIVKNWMFAVAAVEKFGDRVVAGLDARDGKLAVSGWQEQTEVELVEFARNLQEIGYERIIVTDIATDGALSGPNLELANQVMDQVEMSYIVSGGVSSIYDLRAVESTRAEGVIVGKAIYEGMINLSMYYSGRNA